MASRILSVIVLGSLISACGGAGGAAQGNPSTQAEPSPPRPGSSAAEAQPQTPAKAEAEDAAPRELRYVMTPEGLEIEVEGLRFTPAAKATRVPGGWGVQVSVKARVRDDQEYSLLAPEAQQLAFAGTVTRKDGKTEDFGDDRSGDTTLLLVRGEPKVLERNWPGKTAKALGKGEKLDLQVGLWGLGRGPESRRPVKRFFRVTLVSKGAKPKAVVGPPESVGAGSHD